MTAVMGNFESAIKANETALNSEGSASRENAKAMESLEGTMQRLRTAWENFSRQMVDSGTIKDVIDPIIKALELLGTEGGQALVKVALGLGALKLGAKGLSKVVNSINAVRVATLNLGAVQTAEGVTAMTSSIGGLTGVLAKAGAVLMSPVGLIAGLTLLGAFFASGKDPTHGYFEDMNQSQKDLTAKRKEYNDLLSKETLTPTEVARLKLLQAEIELIQKKKDAQTQKVIDADKGEYGGKTVGGVIDITGGVSSKSGSQYVSTLEKTVELREKLEKLSPVDDPEEYIKTTEELEKYNEKLVTQATEMEEVVKALESKKKAGHALTEEENQRLEVYNKLLTVQDLLASKDSGFSNIESMASSVKKLGESFGVTVDEAGKLDAIDLNTFISSMEEAGFSTEEITQAIEKLKEEKPDVDVKVNGKEKALKDLEVIDAKKIKEKEAKVKAKTKEAEQKINNVDNKKIKDKPFSIVATLKGLTSKAKKFLGLAKGTQNFEGGLAMVNDQKNPPNGDPTELIEQDGQLFFANGRNAVLPLKKGAKVYNATETQEMLGRGTTPISSFANGNISYGKRKPAEKNESFDKKLASLQHKQDLGIITEEQFIKSYRKMSTTMKTSLDQWRSWQKSYYAYVNKKATEHADNIIEKLNTESGYSHKNVVKAIKDIKRMRDQGKISAEEEKQYLNETYQLKLDNELKRVESSEKSYNTMKKLIKDYYTHGKIDAGQYFQYLDKLEEANVVKAERKVSLLSMFARQQQTGIDAQIEGLQKQKQALQEANEAEEDRIRLQELQDNLARARASKKMVYVEGQGFVLGSDSEAVNQAQKELDDYNKSIAQREAERAIDAQIYSLQQARDAWDTYIEEIELAMEIQKLEEEAGMTMADVMEEAGVKGNKVTEDFVNMYRRALAEAKRLHDEMNKYTGTPNKKPSKTTSKKSGGLKGYAKGTTNADEGIAKVGENGEELRILNRGDGIIPHNLTENLMDIGRYSMPQLARMLSNNSNDTGSVTEFTFGKGSIIVQGDNGETLARDIISSAKRIITQETHRR